MKALPTSRADRSASFHLLEVGLSMPLETFLRDKLEGLAGRGVRVTVSATAVDRLEATRLRGVEVVVVPWWDEPTPRMVAGMLVAALRVGLRSPRALRATIRAARRPIRERRGSPLGVARRLRSYLPLALLDPDIVHFEWNTAAIQYLPMADLWPCPTVVSCRGSNVNLKPNQPDAEGYRRGLRVSFDRATAIHCVSDHVAAQAAELGMEPSRAWLVRPGVDSVVFRPAHDERASARAAAASRPLRVVSVGELRWLKAHEYAVRTVALLARRNVPVTLEIIGGDPAAPEGEDSDRVRIEHAIARSGVGDLVHLTGTLSSEGVRERMQTADVLLHTSLTEGLPNVLLEAMACGLPVVVGAYGGVEEAVRDGVDGFVVPLRGVTEAADALQALYEDEALRLRMGCAARERVESDFCLQHQLDELLTMYQSLRNGVTRSTRPPTVARNTQLRLLSVGPLCWTQGLDDAMHAVSIVRGRGIDCRQRIFGEGPYLGALWFARHQLGLERYVELRVGEELSRLSARALLDGPRGASELLACAQWRRQLEWADVLLDTSLRDPPHAALAAARAAGVEAISAAEDPSAVAETLIAIAVRTDRSWATV